MSRGYLAFYLLFCALIAVVVWMLAYSLILQTVLKDGRILHLMATSNPFAPFHQFIAFSNNRSSNWWRLQPPFQRSARLQLRQLSVYAARQTHSAMRRSRT